MKVIKQSPVTSPELQSAKPRSRMWVWLKRGLLGLLFSSLFCP